MVEEISSTIEGGFDKWSWFFYICGWILQNELFLEYGIILEYGNMTTHGTINAHGEVFWGYATLKTKKCGTKCEPTGSWQNISKSSNDIYIQYCCLHFKLIPISPSLRVAPVPKLTVEPLLAKIQFQLCFSFF